MKQVSVVVPTLNEENNIKELVERLDSVSKSSNVQYEIIFVDDHSKDKTRETIRKLSRKYPVFFHLKKGKQGKAYSLLEGFDYANFPYIAMIDADLQYPPEAIVPMLEKIGKDCDIVVANRKNLETSFARKLFSRGFAFLFSRFLHNLNCDVQSGLKVFRRRVIKEVKVEPTPWTFDLEFLLKAKNYGYSIKTHDIVFSQRKSGQSKIVLWKVIWEIGIGAIKMRLKKHKPLLLASEDGKSMIGAGIAYKRKRFVTHTTLHHRFSAVETFSRWQNYFIATILFILITVLFVWPMISAIILVGILSAIYFIDVFLNIFLVIKSLGNPPELKSTARQLKNLDHEELPVYSILCPLYQEANILPAFVKAISQLDWPKDKLDVMLLLEENDRETIETAKSMQLPEFFRIVIVPHSMPKTKPKACNYGLCHARGEYVVIYDAEDVPDPLQLKKAYLGFQKSPSSVRCLQAKLNYYNPHQNFLTRLFTAEYSLWFELALPGLQSIETSIPLGGTSNHFRTRDLLELEGWDPFNVTEDCDLGVRIFARGYHTAIIDSITLEEANSRIGNWLRQRSRWIKGYMQTYLVHMRNPWKFFRENGVHALLFQLIVGGKMAFILINPILWLATISYFALYSYVGSTIEALYPPAVFYMAVTSLIFGNFLAMYYYMIGCAKRKHWSLIKYVFLIPFYWLLVSTAGLVALYQLFVKPHYWEKTLHGLHLQSSKRKNSYFLGWLPFFCKDKEKIFAKSKTQKFKREPILGRTNKTKYFWKKIKKRKWLKLLVSREGLFFQMLLVSNFINFVFNAYLGRVLTFENFALVTIVNTFWYIATIFIYPLGTTVNRQAAHLSASRSKSISLGFLNFLLKKTAIWVIAISFIWIVFSPLTSIFFKIEDPLVLPFFALAIVSGVVMIAYYSFLQGNLFFISAGAISLLESLSKFVLAIAFVYWGAFRWVYLSIPLSLFSAALFGIFLLSMKKIKAEKQTKQTKFSFPKKFFGASFLNNVSIAIFLSLDIVLVKHFFSPELAGQYALISLVGKMVFFLGSMPNMFTVTFVGRFLGLRKNPVRILWAILGSTATIISIGFLIFGLLGNITVPLLFGAKAHTIVDYLPVYVFAMAIFTLANVLVTYHLAKKNYFFNILLFVVSLGMIFGIVAFHQSIKEIVWVIFSSAMVGFLSVFLFHVFEKKFKFLRQGVWDFVDVFFGSLPNAKTKNVLGKSILIFNWRDTRHSYSGGAEIYIHELATIWAKQGNQVTIFCGNDNKSFRSEIIDGVEIVRRGGFYLVYLWAFLYYFIRFRGKYDVIIDCQNGVPFFTPLYTKEPVYCLMHHVHQEVFFRYLSKPLAAFASWLEKDLMPWVYRDTHFITVSKSSQIEIEKIGLGKAGTHIVNPGVHLNSFVLGQKNESPMVLYLGRLKAYKSVDVLLRAFRHVIEDQPESKLIIAGSGDAEDYLKDLAVSLELTDQQVIFKGNVSEKEKIALLQKAWVLVNPSLMEGWGIVVIEANACGTPVIASDVPGLRDSVKQARSGRLVPYGDIDAFAKEISSMLQDQELREKMQEGARDWADKFGWEKSSESFYSFIFECEKYERNK
ncbi:MAG: glycosyltransferase [Patescibacteria group bacterium]|nr:glycosyltransferase [Patescibacteria group bacterium]